MPTQLNRGDSAAIRVTEHDKERRLQVATRVLQASRDFRRQDISRRDNQYRQ